MYYGNIIYYDVANGIGCRTSLFVSGCRHHCKNCFNPETWAFDYGKPFTDQTMQQIITSLEPCFIQGLTILGGEPLEPENIPDVARLVTLVKDTYPNKTIWVYTGYLYETLIEKAAKAPDLWTILTHIDTLVDGPFLEQEKDLRLAYRGSKNQRIIHVPTSLKEQTVVPHQDL